MIEFKHHFAAALLAGGQSKRMGRDKAWLDWNGRPLWEVQLDKLKALEPAHLVISSREKQGLITTDAKLIFDSPDQSGPLSALSQVLESKDLPVLVMAVDMPFVSIAFLQEMLQQSRFSNTGIVFKSDYGYEPLCAIYSSAVLPLLHQSIAQGNMRLQTFVQATVDAGLTRVLDLTKAQEGFFLNLNTPEDFKWTPQQPLP